jgi:hypothetical protein
MLGMDASEIIAAAIAAGGGNLAVGKELGISDEGVRLWKERGVVPAKYVIALAELGQMAIHAAQNRAGSLPA